MPRVLQQRLLFVVGSLALVATLFAAYVRDVFADSAEFADRVAVAVEEPVVRAELTSAVVGEMVDAAPELIAIQPLLVTIVDGVLATDTANSLIRVAVDDVHRTLFTDDQDTILLEVSQLILVAKAQITALDPELGALIPDDLTDSIIEARERAVTIDAARFVADLDTWTYLLLAVTVAAFVAALWMAPRASNGLIGVGLALILASALAVVALVVGRWILIDTSNPVSVAFWDAFMEPFDLWILTLAGLGAVLAAIAWFGVGRLDPSERARHLASIVAPPSSLRGRVNWGVVVLVIGILVIAHQALVIRVIVTTIGVGAVVAGGRELLAAVFPSLVEGVAVEAVEADAPERDDRSVRLSVVGRSVATASIVLVAVGAGVVMAADDGPEPETTTGCNGSDELCERRLDDITIAATHNSHAAAAAGFLNGYQTFDIAQQLDDGVRGLLIDVYFGFDDDGLVITDRAPLTPDERDDLVADVGAAAVNAAEATAASFEASGVSPELYLCHALCEIGATRFVDGLTSVTRFLGEHPREVIVMIIQDEGPRPADIAGAFEASGLIDLVHVQDPSEPFPTLGEMIERGGRVFVTAENRSGEFDWYHDAFTFVQDTPFGYAGVDDFDCAPNRGEATSPLLLANHWVSPVSPTGSEAANAADVLADRVAMCEAERSMTPNLIAVDFYDRGDLLDYVDELNGMADGD